MMRDDRRFWSHTADYASDHAYNKILIQRINYRHRMCMCERRHELAHFFVFAERDVTR